MKKHEFIEKAMVLGASLEEALILEEIYNPIQNSTEEDRKKGLYILENKGTATSDLADLGKQYKYEILIPIMVEDAVVELDQRERDCNLGYNERVQFKTQLIARINDFLQDDSDSVKKDEMPDF
ncbi:hypothetical protein H9655_08315 [Cytobacillus sp. Sa5YUA1]|uniref:Uncharacterized protein n=1 Tax=Cytobacillus stercorigallinarum TaxID=2762240 RepID=A0ABR8QND3_9BACI|nr:hypothetical protein [Cytobacillus stercorigallinarum]MBD7937033.1 hypothetical protein [Cytobacillus stercorigallinarum]